MKLLPHQGRARSPLRAATSRTTTSTSGRRARSDAPCLAMLLLLAWQAACAQTADDLFNSGAHFYISNNIPEALVPVEQGLKQYPDDVKLKKLYELLKQQQQQQQQSQQNQQNQSQQQKSQSRQNQKQQQNQQQSQQSSQQQKQNEQKQSEQQKQEQQQQRQPQKSGEKQEKEQGLPVAAGQMTPEEAKRLLDAQKGDEQFLQLKPQGKPENPNQPVKDW